MLSALFSSWYPEKGCTIKLFTIVVYFISFCLCRDSDSLKMCTISKRQPSSNKRTDVEGRKTNITPFWCELSCFKPIKRQQSVFPITLYKHFAQHRSEAAPQLQLSKLSLDFSASIICRMGWQHYSAFTSKIRRTIKLTELFLKPQSFRWILKCHGKSCWFHMTM